ncbi:MAG: hypothetical protein CSA72_09820 [Rhodobacterales bacterium]|nr:MAG: hypothetical protein CSA72_09820 [Rhodobacterales bacterium]
MKLLTLILCLIAGQAAACRTALLLAVDVSNSVDEAEYRLQVDGLSDALTDPTVAEELARGGSALAVMHWSGTDKQLFVLDWTRITHPAQTDAIARRLRALPRSFLLSDTAPGEALSRALDSFASAPDCARRVIDISGDGTANAGRAVAPLRQRAARMGITINAIGIEDHQGLSITTYYRRHIITSDGFVMTARRHADYPRAIRAKILREISALTM